MGRTVDASTARLRLVLALVMGGLVAALVSSLSQANPPAVVALALLAVAVAAVTVLGSHLARSMPRAAVWRPGAAYDAPSALASRVTDPLHHPLRPRAPGLV